MVYLFPLAVVVISILAALWPQAFTGLQSWIIPLLGVSMFSMGMTLQPQDFKLVLKKPWVILTGLLAQYLIMSSLAYLLARSLNLPAEIAIGLIMVGTCPGGVASNVMCFLARGDVALSVTLTACSTVLSPLLTPALTLLLADQWIEVDLWAMCYSIIKIVILPVTAGMVLHKPLCRFLPAIPRYMPLVSMLAIILIIAAIVGINADNLMQIGAITLIAAILHNLLGLLSGYLLAKICRFAPAQQRTLSLEVGLQNSGLAASLCKTHFSAYPAAMLPAAFFSVWHNISGALLAAYWSNSDKRNDRNTQPDTETTSQTETVQ